MGQRFQVIRGRKAKENDREQPEIRELPPFEEALLGHLDGLWLPVEFRTVVWLSDVEELSYREIGEIIGCPLGTVASRLYRGHSLLRERLREYGRQRGLMKE